MSGIGGGLFSPDTALSRGQAAVVLSLLFHLNTGDIPAQPTFGDVGLGHPFRKYIEAIYKAGLTAGCSSNPPEFCPDDLRWLETSRASCMTHLRTTLRSDADPV